MAETTGTESVSLLKELKKGLAAERKTLPCKYFYDERGSKLFEQITRLREYYPTRTELGILKKHIGEIAGLLGPDCLLIEYGSGASRKIRLLLDNLSRLAAYVPIDISADHLQESAELLGEEYPDLRILPLAADYTDSFAMPDFDFPYAKRVVFFPGSTIGNFTPPEARRFLARMAQVSGTLGGILIGVDLHKDAAILEAAYNDARGVTAAFNLNMLRRMNAEYDANFDLDAFRHTAVFDSEHSRIEMHLLSRKRQTVRLGGETFHFAKGESILTEYSYKYTLDGFARLVSPHFRVEHVWTDARKLFSVQYLSVKDTR